MDMLYCHVDLAESYDDDLDYSQAGLEADIYHEPPWHKGRRISGTFCRVALSALFQRLSQWYEKGHRYRLLCSYGRLVARRSDLPELLDSGEYKYNEIEGEWINKNSGHMSSGKSILFALEKYPCIVSMIHAKTGCEITLLDIANYGMAWEEFFKLNPQQDKGKLPWGQWECKLAPDVWNGGVNWLQYVYNRWCKMCKEHKLGRPSITYAAQGSAVYYQFPNAYEIRQSPNNAALDIEAGGYFGGRQEPFGYGRYDGQCTLFDISAFYPYIASRVSVPTVWSGFHKTMTLEEAAEVSERYYCIAAVQLRDADRSFPYRTKFQTIYPVGSFRTVLHHVEFRRALAAGKIEKLYALSRYQFSPALSQCSSYLLSLRIAAEQTGNQLMAHFAKLQAVGFLGKLGSRMGRWEDCPQVIPPGRDASWITTKLGSGEAVYYRSVGWKTQRKLDEFIPHKGSLAMAGAITAYGRDFLWRLVSYVGLNHVFYVSTDSLIVDRDGTAALRLMDSQGGFAAGRLRQVCSAERCIIAGHGLYEIGDRSGCQGYKNSGKENERGDKAGSTTVQVDASFHVKGNVSKGRSNAGLTYREIMRMAEGVAFIRDIPHNLDITQDA